MKWIASLLLLLGSLHAAKESVKVGVLHSITGTMAESEKPVVEATLLAIDEINANGGVLGKKIEPIFYDGASQEEEFVKGAKKLILEDKVNVVFGCWTSASRIAVRPIFENNNAILFYPVQYEGLEASESIVYLGAAPNQQIIPGTVWSASHLGKRFFLVGSDYIFPRTANVIIRRTAKAVAAEIVGEEYVSVGGQDFEALVKRLIESKPDVILNTLNGDSNRYFFNELRKQGVTSAKIPTMSFSIGLSELTAFDLLSSYEGDYACWNYFQSISSPENREFIEHFRAKYGADRVLDDPMEAAHIGVHLWVKAVEKGKSFAVNVVLRNLYRMTYKAPEGVVVVDGTNNHLWKTVRIGKLTSEGDFEIVWTSDKPVRPRPFPLVWGPLP